MNVVTHTWFIMLLKKLITLMNLIIGVDLPMTCLIYTYIDFKYRVVFVKLKSCCYIICNYEKYFSYPFQII